MNKALSTLGFRGLTLFFLGVVWLAVGSRLITEPDPDLLHKLPIEYFPLWARVALWWVPGFLAISTAIFHWMPTRIGFIALVIPTAFRALSFLIAFIFSAADRDVTYWPAALTEAVVWSGVTAYVMIVSAWPDPTGTRDS